MALSKEWKTGLITGGVGLGVLFAVIWYMKKDTDPKVQVSNPQQNQTAQNSMQERIITAINGTGIQGGRRSKRRSNKSRASKKK